MSTSKLASSKRPLSNTVFLYLPTSSQSRPSTFPHRFAVSMASPAVLGRAASRTLRPRVRIPQTNQRGLAAAASGSFQYETGDAAGVKFASRDLPGPTTSLAVVAKAGSRFQLLPGFSDALEKFAFKVRLLPSHHGNTLVIWHKSNISLNSQPSSALP